MGADFGLKENLMFLPGRPAILHEGQAGVIYDRKWTLLRPGEVSLPGPVLGISKQGLRT